MEGRGEDVFGTIPGPKPIEREDAVRDPAVFVMPPAELIVFVYYSLVARIEPSS